MTWVCGRTLGQRVFSRPLKSVEEKEGWRESMYRLYKSGQQSMRVAVYGCKHDAVMFELLLKQFCHFEEEGCTVDRMIDTAALGRPKVLLLVVFVDAPHGISVCCPGKLYSIILSRSLTLQDWSACNCTFILPLHRKCMQLLADSHEGFAYCRFLTWTNLTIVCMASAWGVQWWRNSLQGLMCQSIVLALKI